MNKLLIAVKPEIKKLKEKIKEINPEKTIIFGLNNENKVKALIELEEIISLNAEFIALENELNETIDTAKAIQKMYNFISFKDWDFHLIQGIIPEEKTIIELKKNIRKRKTIIFSAIKPKNEKNVFGSIKMRALIEEKKPLLFIYADKKYFESSVNETAVISIPEKAFLVLKLDNEINVCEIK